MSPAAPALAGGFLVTSTTEEALKLREAKDYVCLAHHWIPNAYEVTSKEKAFSKHLLRAEKRRNLQSYSGGTIQGVKYIKLNIQKTKIMASGPITSWQVDRETMRDLIFLGSKITADGDCSREIKRCLLLRRKTRTNLYSVLKSRGISLPTKIHIVRSTAFPVVMYICNSCTKKKAEH